MKLTMRGYRDEEDYQRVRDFLRHVFLVNGQREHSWHVCRFDYWRWHGIENERHFRINEAVLIWETEDGRIAAVLNPEGRGEAFLQVHPDLRTLELEEEMIGIAEDHFSFVTQDGNRSLRIWADQHDELRHGILARRGYAKGEISEHQRRRSLDVPIQNVPVPTGYVVRALGGDDELPARSWASWRAFHPDKPENQYEGWEWYRNIQRAPLYRRNLDMVSVAPAGEVSSFCTVWFDDITLTAYFEPVGTVPEHRRRGLGKAVMSEGLRRLKRLGATAAYVGSYSPEAHALYSSVGFMEINLSEIWTKNL